MKIEPTCPNCGQPRRLVGTKGSRRLECSSIGRGCPPTEFLPDHLHLSINQMVDFMSVKSFSNGSNTKRSEQIKARRAASAVSSYAESPLLAADEVATLEAAAGILERLGTAAELAKKELARKEKAEEQRRAARRKEAAALFADGLALPDSHAEAIPLVLAMSDAKTGTLKVYFADAHRSILDVIDESFNPKQPLGKRMGWTLHDLHRDMVSDLLGSIEHHKAPTATDMAREFVEAVRRAMAAPEQQARATHLIERMTTRMVREKLEAANPNAGKEKT